jgi:hypothetical protein
MVSHFGNIYICTCTALLLLTATQVSAPDSLAVMCDLLIVLNAAFSTGLLLAITTAQATTNSALHHVSLCIPSLPFLHVAVQLLGTSSGIVQREKKFSLIKLATKGQFVISVFAPHRFLAAGSYTTCACVSESDCVSYEINHSKHCRLAATCSCSAISYAMQDTFDCTLRDASCPKSVAAYTWCAHYNSNIIELSSPMTFATYSACADVLSH